MLAGIDVKKNTKNYVLSYPNGNTPDSRVVYRGLDSSNGGYTYLWTTPQSASRAIGYIQMTNYVFIAGNSADAFVIENVPVLMAMVDDVRSSNPVNA